MNTQKGMAGTIIVLILAALAAVGIAYYFLNRTVIDVPKEENAVENTAENEGLGASAIDAASTIHYPIMEEIVE